MKPDPSEGARGPAGEVEPAATTQRAHGARLASAVTFVDDLDLSAGFYRELLRMEVTVLGDSAALLVGVDGVQLYLRSMGPGAQHGVGNVGVQYVIWTAADEEDLGRCEQFLNDRSAHVHTETSGGFRLVEGRDPSGVPVLMSYPGPDQTARHQIMSRIYTW